MWCCNRPRLAFSHWPIVRCMGSLASFLCDFMSYYSWWLMPVENAFSKQLVYANYIGCLDSHSHDLLETYRNQLIFLSFPFCTTLLVSLTFPKASSSDVCGFICGWSLETSRKRWLSFTPMWPSWMSHTLLVTFKWSMFPCGVLEKVWIRR